MTQITLKEQIENKAIADSANAVVTKWEKTLNSKGSGFDPILNESKRYVTAQLLDTQLTEIAKERGVSSERLNENVNSATGVENWNPILISMTRRLAPRLIAYDVCGVQPMTGPTGLIFCLKARYANDPSKTQNDHTLPEAMGFDEVNAGYSGDGTANSGDSFGPNTYVRGGGIPIENAETQPWANMGVSIERTEVVAKGRQLRAEYSQELAEDMKNVHGLNAENELINILVNEIVAEKNREIVGRIYAAAEVGGQFASTAGIFDLDNDSDGRWSVEKYKGLITAIEFDSNAVAIRSRRGKANKLFVSANVGSILHQAGVLDFAPALQASTNLNVDPSGATYAGRLAGRHDVYIDPYATGEGYCVGFKGIDQYDAGLYYAPYVALQMSKAVSTDIFTNAIGFKTRYGIASNPFTSIDNNSNRYYRKCQVTNLI